MSPTHILLHAVPAWGHTRPLCFLAAQLASDSDVVVTLLTSPLFFERCQNEVARVAQKHDIRRIRVASLVKTGSPDMFVHFGELSPVYGHVYKKLLAGEPLECASSATVFEAVPAPSAVILDFFAVGQYAGMKALHKEIRKHIPVMAWVPCSASDLIHLAGPEHLGGLGKRGREWAENAAKAGQTPDQFMLASACGDVTNVPGLPSMYDWEFYPQELGFDNPVAAMLPGIHSIMTTSDGVFIATSDVYEKETLDAVRAWLQDDWKIPTFAIGPVVAPFDGHADLGGNEVIKTFLDKKLEQHGAKSVVLISFGTIFWPPKTEYVEELIEAFVEKDVPFILATASPFTNVPEQLSERVASSGLGLLTKWSPQQFILNHPATGWFLTHGGHGGITESLTAGIPMICWPFGGDQPAAAAHITTNLKVAFELFQVRTGVNGLRPIHPDRGGVEIVGTREAAAREIREVVGKMKGEEGRVIRENVERVKEQYERAWSPVEDGGFAAKELKEFMSRFVHTEKGLTGQTNGYH